MNRKQPSVTAATLAAALALGAAAACSPSGGNTPTAQPGGSGGAFAGTGAVTGSGGLPGSGGQTTAPASGGDGPIFGGGVEAGTRGPDEGCTTSSFQGELLPSNILFVMDRSGSMNCNLPPTTDSATCEANPVAVNPADPTKWSVMTSSMSSALDQIAGSPATSVGLTFFSNDDVCGVTSTPNVGLALLAGPQLDSLKNALANGKPRGGTPIVGATILAYKHLHQQAKAPGNRFVVLVTDGKDSCIDKYAEQGVTGDVVAQLLDVELPKAISVNIRTFVIGAPGSEEARGLLSKIAFLGGTGRAGDCDHDSADPAPGAECHFDMTRTGDFATDLSNALKSITGKAALTCEFDVPQTDAEGKPIDRTKVNVSYSPGGDATKAQDILQDTTKGCADGANGWQYLPDDDTRIQVCGPQCDTIRADPTAKVDIITGCPTKTIN